MATIANLAVSLTARIGNFEKGFKRATKIARRFGRDLSRHIKTISRYGAAITGVAVGAISVLVKQQLSAIDRTNKLSRVLGFQTENLVALQHAAELAGFEQGKLEQTMQALIKRVGEARADTGPFVTFLQKYDKTLLSAIKSTTNADQALVLIADAIKNAKNEADAAAIANAAFSRTGVRMTEIFRELGADALPKARKEAEKIGFAFSAIDGRQVEAANDAMTRAARVITGMARRIAIQLAPFIEVAANRFRDFAMRGQDGGKIVTNAINMILGGLGKMMDFFELLKAGWHGFVAVVSGAAATLIQPARHFIKAWDRVLKFVGINVMGNLNQFFDDLSSGFADQTTKAANKASEAFEKFNNGFHSKNAKVFFNELQADAKKAQETVKELKVPSVADSIEQAQKSKTGEFRQVEVSRIAVGGSRTPQNKPVNRQQGQTMISSLQEIARNTKMGQAVTT